MALGLVVPYSTSVWLERGQSSDPLFCPFVSVNPGKTSPQQAPAAFSLNVHPDPFLTLLCRRNRLSPARENCLATTVFSTNAVLRGICHYSGYCHKYRWLRHHLRESCSSAETARLEVTSNGVLRQAAGLAAPSLEI